MRVIGQSITSGTQIFTHLGYLAAHMPKYPSREVRESSFVTTGISIAVLGALCATLLFRKSKFLPMLGGALILAGMLLAVFAPRRTIQADNAQLVLYTQQMAVYLDGIIGENSANGETIPQYFHEVWKYWGILPRAIEDGWKRDFRIEKVGDGKTARYRAVSAGPDGKFGSGDDIHDL